jgi:hypothetical protein
MRKSLWIISALLVFAAIAAPCVRADSATFTCTGDSNDGFPYGPCLEATPTAPDVTFSTTGTTIDVSWYTAANPAPIAVTLPGTWNDTDLYSWFASNDSFIIFDHSILPTGSTYGDADTNLPSGAGLSEFGTLAFNGGSSTASAPEPGTVTLMLVGIGLVLVMRKRIACGLPHAA